MSSNASSERLRRLRADANRSLRSLLRGTAFPTATPKAVSGGGRSGESLGTPEVSAANAPDAASEAVVVNVNLNGGTIILDDERRIRALAKEIKRLITEDKRRGLTV